jgi:hypothetical protein
VTARVAASCSAPRRAGDGRSDDAKPNAPTPRSGRGTSKCASGQVEDPDGLITAEWAREWLRFQDGEVDDPLVGLLGTPTGG